MLPLQEINRVINPVAETEPQINPEAQAQLQRFFKQLNVLFLVFLTGLVVVIVGVLAGSNLGRNPSNPETEDLMLWAVPALALAQLLLSQFVYKSRIKRVKSTEKLYEKMAGFKNGMLLRFIVLNSASLLSAIGFLMTGQWLFLGVSLIVAGVMFFYRPTVKRFIEDLELDAVETKVVQDHTAG